MEALAADLRDVAPDLAGQFQASRPRLRRNSGFGLFTEATSDPARPFLADATGDFGTVHAMVGDLPDPVAFTARLQSGRFVGLMGDSYGQDTRSIDFASVHFSQVFTVDPSGRSIPFQSASSPPSEPQVQRVSPRPRPSVPTTQPRQPQVRVTRPDDFKSLVQAARQGSDALRVAVDDARRDARPVEASAQPPVDKVTLLIGAWTVIAVVAVLAVVLFRVSWIFALVAAFWVGAALRKPRALAALQRGIDGWNASRAAQRG